MGNGKVRAVGMGMAMQGSGHHEHGRRLSPLQLNDFGFYTLRIAAADMGTGCDTTLAQIAAEALDCPLDKVITFSARIRIPRPTTPAPMRRARSTSPARRPRSVRSSCAIRSRRSVREMMGVKRRGGFV